MLEQYIKNRILKEKNSYLELEKYFKPINVSIDYMNKFSENEITKKKTFAKNTWRNCCNSLINYIPEAIEKR